MQWPPPESREFFPANWQDTRHGHPIRGIIAHGTVGTDSRGYLQRGGDRSDGSDRKVSIHTLIDKAGTRWRIVNDDRAANHAGFGTAVLGGVRYSPTSGANLNWCTLGFELENLQNGRDPYTEDQLLAMGYQINEWRAKYGALPLLRHADVDPAHKTDTVGLSVAEMEQWARRAAQKSATPQPLPPVAPDIPYFVSVQPASEQRITSLFVSRRSPIQPIEIVRLWGRINEYNINAALFMAHWHAEDANWQCQSAGGRLLNPLNIRARADLPSSGGWLDFTGGANGGGGLWLGLDFTLHWLKWRYGAAELTTIDQIGPVWLGAVPGSPEALRYVNGIKTTYQAIVQG